MVALVVTTVGLVLLAVPAIAWLMRRAGRDLGSGKLPSATMDDHRQAVNQIQAMRGPRDPHSSPEESWDGVDRLGSAGLPREGGAI